MTSPDSVDQPGTSAGPVIVLSGVTIRPGMEDDEAAAGAELDALMRAMSGFISAKDYTAEDGEVLSVFRFDSDDAVIRWRDDPVHRRYQAVTDDYYESFWVQTAQVHRAYEWRDGQKRQLPVDPSLRATD